MSGLGPELAAAAGRTFVRWCIIAFLAGAAVVALGVILL